MSDRLRYGFEVTEGRTRLRIDMPPALSEIVQRDRQIGRALGALTPRTVKIVDIETRVRNNWAVLYANTHNIVSRLKPQVRTEAAAKVVQVLTGCGALALREGMQDPHLSLTPPGAGKGVTAFFTWPEGIDNDQLEETIRTQMAEMKLSLGEGQPDNISSSFQVDLAPDGASTLSIDGVVGRSRIRHWRRRPAGKPSLPVHELSIYSADPIHQLSFFAGMVAWAHPEELLAKKAEAAILPK